MKVKQDSRKINFGSRKRGKAKKSFNKHDSKNSAYHKRNASRNG